MELKVPMDLKIPTVHNHFCQQLVQDSDLLRECTDEHGQLHDNPTILGDDTVTLLNAVVSEEQELSIENIEPVMRAAHYLLAMKLYSKCMQFINNLVSCVEDIEPLMDVLERLTPLLGC